MGPSTAISCDKGSQNADGDLHRQQVPADVIHQQQKGGSKQHRGREQLAVVIADIPTAQVGDDQTHPADQTADRNRSGGDQRGAYHYNQPQQGGIDPQRAGFFLAQGQQVQPPADEQQRDKPQCHGKDSKADIHPAGAG